MSSNENYNPGYNALEIEKAVIGAALTDEVALASAIEQIDVRHFEIKAMRSIWEAVAKMFRAGEPVDAVTVAEELGPTGLARIGGSGVIFDACDSVANFANVGQYLKRLGDRYKSRQLSKLGAIVKDALEKEGFDSAYEQAQSHLISLGEDGGKAGFSSGADVALDWYGRISELKDFPEKLEEIYLPTGFPAYDQKYGGLPHGISILAGRPAMGKTSLALSVVINAAKLGKSILFFSLEMSQSQLMTRLVSGVSGIESRKLEMGTFLDEESPVVFGAIQQIAEWDLYINESAYTLGQIKSQIEQWRLLNGRSPDLVIIDYLGLVQVSNVKGENADRVAATRTMKTLSVYFTKMERPLLMLCQLNRDVEQRSDKRPQLADLRDSGEIEQSAVRVDCLYRDEYYNPATERPGIAELLTRKNRFGPCGEVLLSFDPNTTNFSTYIKEGANYAQ